MSAETRSDVPESQRRVVRELVDGGMLSAAQADAVLGALARAGSSPSGPRPHVAEVVGYLGGGLLLAGEALVVGTSWEQLSQAGRVGIVSAITLALLVAGVLIAGGPRGLLELRARPSATRGRIVGVLFALGSGTAAIAAGTAAPYGDEPLVGGGVGLLIAAGAYALLRSVAPLLAAGVLSGVGAAGLADQFDGDSFKLGVALFGIGIGWLALSGLGVVRHRAVGLAIGAVIALIGAQIPLGSYGDQGWAYGGTLLLASGCVTWHLLAHEPVLLLAGVVGVTLAVPEMVWDWTDGAVGGAAAVVIAGAVLLAASGAAFVLRAHPPNWWRPGSRA